MPTWSVGAPLKRPVLSPREIEVLVAWLHTDSKEDVGRALFITRSTVNTHLSRIREKYENVGRPARTKAALAARAIQDGFVDLFDL
ncbi:MAG TPA: helix-turn-helix transcriptional regulator [Mycobacterium sp.]